MRTRFLSIVGLAILLQSAACSRDENDVDRRKPGDVLGDYALEGAAHVSIRTSDFRSRVLLIHFFEPDSEACRAQVTSIRELWFPHRAGGMNVLGVCPETGRDEVLRTVRSWDLPYPVCLDRERKFTREFAPRRYPWNVVVGRDGKILHSGSGDWNNVQSAVKQALAVNVQGPDRVSVRHLLIAFEGSFPAQPTQRSMKDAAKLAAELFDRANAGEDFDALAKEYSSDPLRRTYKLTNFNVAPDDDSGESERGIVAAAFGDVAFSLEVGAIGMAKYHPLKSRSGWHIIKRLE